METKRADIKKTSDILKVQRFLWQEQVIFGLILFLMGFFIINNPANFFKSMFELIIPCAIIGLALVIMVRPFRNGLPENYRTADLSRGAGIFCAGIFAFFLPLALWIVFNPRNPCSMDVRKCSDAAFTRSKRATSGSRRILQPHGNRYHLAYCGNPIFCQALAVSSYYLLKFLVPSHYCWE